MSKSSEIILNWINNEIKLRPKIIDIKKSFSNGYHLAEIFYILKLITPEEFSKFLNTENYSDKKSNFSKIEKICQKLFNLIIPEEDINLIINKDYSKAVVLLYKIRNCIYKNNIHFKDIQIFGNAFSNNEIHNQIKDIIKRQFFSEEEEEEDNEDEKSNNNTINDNENKNDEINKFEKHEEEKNILQKISQKLNLIDDIKEIKEKDEINDNIKNKTIDKKILNIKRHLPSIKIKRDEKKNNNNEHINFFKNKILIKPKNILAPINHRLLKTKSNSCENIFMNQNKNKQDHLIKFRNTNQTDFFNGTITTKNNLNSQLIDICNFNQKLFDLGVTSNDYKIEEDNNLLENGISTITNIYPNQNMKNINNNNDTMHESMYNTKTVAEISSELKNKIKFKKIENKIKQKEIKRELSQNNIDENKTYINFLKINKNKFFDKNQSMSLMYKNFSNKSLLRRYEYSKEILKNINKENNENDFGFTNYLNQDLPILLSNTKFNRSRNSIKTKENIFNPKKFFDKLDKLNYSTNKIRTEKKQKIKNKNSIIIKDIVLFIIDMAMEGYIYQKQKNQELMDLNTFLKFNIYFLKNKPLRKKLIIIEDNGYKKASKFEDNIDIDKLFSSLTNEEKYLIQDYIYYLGIWNDELIYDNKLRGLKLEYKYINYNSNNSINIFNSNYFGFNDYEPTVLENEDLTLPKYNIDNYIIGNTIIDALEHKFNNNKLNNISQNNTNNISKWEHIPYKIALVGYPLTGRKTVAEKINNKYPNIKVYSINQIIQDYYQLFLKYSDSPEKLKNKKKGKKNEKEKEKDKNKGKKENIFEKQEKQKKLKEMQPIINLIQPYIDYQQNYINNITSSVNNISKTENNNNNTNKNNNSDFFIMEDENLCKLLIKKIEEDFPYIDQEKIKKNSIDLQKNIHDLQKQIEVIKKRKLEAKKPNPKDDFNIEKLEKEIINLKEKSISGFIITDYPNNINQCYLLENYLTGFIDDKRKPRSDENAIIEKISSIIDFKIEPNDKKLNKKSGLNFLIHISSKENIITERFNSLKYDPVDEKIYTKYTFISDKKISERLVDEIPNLPRELFEYYKDEYNNNINKIINLYNQFGFVLNAQKDDYEIHPIGDNNNSNNKNEKIIKTYQFIEAEEIQPIALTDGKSKKNKRRSPKKSPKKIVRDKSKDKTKDKDKDKNQQNDKNIMTTNSNPNDPSNTNKDKDKVYNFICGNIIAKLFLEKEKNDKELFYNAYPQYKEKDKNQIIFAPDLNINEIKTKYKSKSPKKQNKDLKIIDYDSNKINLMINELTSINNKYNKYLAKFIHLNIEQKKNIYTRLNLIQTKFRNYLNRKSNKKKIISNYIKKYNRLFSIDPNLLSHEKVITELNSDIEDLRTEIWKIINVKQNMSINELKEIKNCGFIESELIKFYFNIKELILLETEKFVSILNNIIILYTKKNEKEKDKDRDKDKEKNINELILNFKNEIIIKTELIIKNTKDFKYHLNDKNEIKFDLTLNEITDIILENIETIFKNSIKLLFSYNDKIDTILKRVKKIIYNNTFSDKRAFKSRKKKRKNSENRQYSISMVNDLLTNKDSGYLQEESIKKMFLDEKNKYKYRICYIKSYAIKYIHIMKCTAENIFDNMDEWIVKNVTLQNESLSYLIKVLKQFLIDKTSIDQQNDIDYIELDEFEKVIEDDEINNNNNSNIKPFNNNTSNISNFNGSSHEVKLKPFDNSSVINMNRIYNKINLEYLINDNFLDTKIEEYLDSKISKNKKQIKIKIIPNHQNSSIIENNNIKKNNTSNEDLNSSSGIIKNKNILTDNEFYFDIDIFKFIYKLIKKYEIEDGLINKNIFFQVFIKQFLFSKKKNLNQNIMKDDEEENNIFDMDKNLNFNINSYYNEEITGDKNNQINKTIYPGISNALKNLRAKQIQRILDIFVIHIDKLNYISFDNEIINDKDNDNINNEEEENEEQEKDSIKRKDKKKPTNKISKNKKNEDFKERISRKSINTDLFKDKKNNEEKKVTKLKEIKEETKINEKEKEKEKNEKLEKEKIENEKIENEKNKIEYEIYLNTKEIFTILSLIGVNVLTNEMEQKIENELKDKYFMNKYLNKNDFLEYKFWFESFFEYLNDKNEDENKNKGGKDIKEFLFDVWKNDDNSSYFDFKKFLEVLKINKYVTDYVDFNEVRYYDIIFEQ